MNPDYQIIWNKATDEQKNELGYLESRVHQAVRNLWAAEDEVDRIKRQERQATRYLQEQEERLSDYVRNLTKELNDKGDN